ncbi:MFS transporter [Streptomyces europaeiscabiei]|uniref:MFS transporter n=1 Tax=Streptomyces europaeiscabiei TaxID=146819 RepID=UPI000628489E|nr:MFS transporter [Streptomyces europaeiscabiei]MDX2528408.1 MFS transporter [Streptomyces europaeiscabiei]MDX2761131.1 MFS transporter [Streptomyces europaeiscabiei]MDX3777488.1 MFS transporter [Streptomyces europaeiscabiei]MDX3862771.1 MFS transporter [Streptomyces europaeiscabiei]MDX3870922.1 MFS transporter [Streptomyces europaeiscabiei]
MVDRAVHRRRQALFLLFFLPGIAMSSWVTRTPDVRDQLSLSTGQMGLVLFGLSVGSMIGILCSGRFVSRFGTRPVIALGTLLIIAGTVVIGAGSAVRSAPLVAAGLSLFGAGMGGGEVAINVDGADVERITGTVVLPTLHGCFSLGTVVGGSAGMAATAAAIPVPWHLAVVALVATGILVHALRAVPAGVGINAAPPTPGPGPDPGPAQRSKPQVWKDRKLLLIGAIVLAMALAEGAANDWLPLLMVDGHGLDAAAGSLVFVGFAAAMTLGRFSGGFFLSRFGRAAVVRASAVSGAVGLLLVIFSDNAAVAATAVLFWGLGASLGFPVALSAAGDSGPDQTARVSLVAIIGYVAFLVGPPALGFLGDHYGLRSAMVVVLVFVAAAVLIAPAADTHDRAPTAPDVPPRTQPGTTPAGQQHQGDRS